MLTFEFWTQHDNGDDADAYTITAYVEGPDPSVGLFGYGVEIAEARHVETGEDMDTATWNANERAMLDAARETIDARRDDF